MVVITTAPVAEGAVSALPRSSAEARRMVEGLQPERTDRVQAFETLLVAMQSKTNRLAT